MLNIDGNKLLLFQKRVIYFIFLKKKVVLGQLDGESISIFWDPKAQ